MTCSMKSAACVTWPAAIFEMELTIALIRAAICLAFSMNTFSVL